MSNQQPISTFLGIATAVVLVSSSYAADINVPGDFATIQAAIGDAGTVAGDAVIVAQGEYFENINFNGKAITVRSTDPNDPVVVVNTIINGGGSGSVVTCNSGEGSDTVLSGFVITGGNATNGGGMLNDGTSPTVTNCSFSGNTATGAASNGAGMYNTGSSSPTMDNCTFSGNTAVRNGAGMYNVSSSSPTVTNCTFSGNSASDGGGMGNFNDSIPTVANCILWGDTAVGLGNEIFNDGTSGPMISFSDIEGIRRQCGLGRERGHGRGQQHRRRSAIRGR